MQVIICGKKGDGKSLYAMHRLVQVLRETNHVVITNLAVKLPELNEYVQKKYPGEDLDVPNRVILLEDDQVLMFWRHRPPPRQPYMFSPDVLAEAVAHDPKFMERPPVAYFLDEAHEYWNAREWQLFAKEGQKYLSQCRKLGDMIFAITQVPSNLDAQFRKQSHYYIRVRNDRLRHIKVWLFRFRGQNKFVVRCYQRDPMEGTRETPFDTEEFRLDAKGLANCYDTAKGVGVMGSKADIGARAKGAPLMLIWPMIFGALACIAALPLVLGHAVNSWLAVKKADIGKAVSVMPGLAAPVPLPAVAAASGASTGVAPGLPSSREPTPLQVRYKSVAIAGKRVFVTADDGEVFTESDVHAIYSDSVVLNNGTVLRPAPVKWAAAPAKSTVAVPPQIGTLTGNVPVTHHDAYPLQLHPDANSVSGDSSGVSSSGVQAARPQSQSFGGQ